MSEEGVGKLGLCQLVCRRQNLTLFLQSLPDLVNSVSVGWSESNTSSEPLVGLERAIPLARVALDRPGAHLVAPLRLAVRVATLFNGLFHVSQNILTLSHQGGRPWHTQVASKSIDSAGLALSISLVVEVFLLSLSMGKHGVATAVRGGPLERDSFGAKTALHLELLVLALDQRDHIATEQHLHLSIPILEELVLRDLRLVSKYVHLAASN